MFDGFAIANPLDSRVTEAGPKGPDCRGFIRSVIQSLFEEKQRHPLKRIAILPHQLIKGEGIYESIP